MSSVRCRLSLIKSIYSINVTHRHRAYLYWMSPLRCNAKLSGECELYLTRFTKIDMQATYQMAADKAAVGLSRVLMYE